MGGKGTGKEKEALVSDIRTISPPSLAKTTKKKKSQGGRPVLDREGKKTKDHPLKFGVVREGVEPGRGPSPSLEVGQEKGWDLRVTEEYPPVE